MQNLFLIFIYVCGPQYQEEFYKIYVWNQLSSLQKILGFELSVIFAFTFLLGLSGYEVPKHRCSILQLGNI